MEVVLKRIKAEKWDSLLEMVDVSTFFDKRKNEILSIVESYSEEVLLNEEKIVIDINPNEYLNIVRSAPDKGASSIKIAEKLHKDFVKNGKSIPLGIMMEKELWTYLNLTVFFDVVNEKYCYDKKDGIKGKIERTYFNYNAPIDRTGLRYLWNLAYSTNLNETYELTAIAWRFIDTFKAVHECLVGRNYNVLKAFALAIKKLDCDPRIKNKNNRKLIPKHMRNFACPNMLETYSEIDELADTISEQMLLIMDNIKLQEAATREEKAKEEKKKKIKK